MNYRTNGTMAERNEEWVRLHAEEGWTLTEIGEEYGVTRERVRQVVRELGVPQWVTREVRLMAVRGPRVPRVDWECDVCGKRERRTPSGAECRTCGSERCVAVVKGMYTDEEMLDALRGLAYRLGHVPRTEDVNADPGTPVQGTYHRRFGSLSAAQEAAGLPPTKPGYLPRPVEDPTTESGPSGADRGPSSASR